MTQEGTIGSILDMGPKNGQVKLKKGKVPVEE